jgi:hypothetical protein
LAIIFVTAAVSYFVLTAIRNEFSAESSFAAGVLAVAAYVCVVVLLLAPLVTLAWFIFTVWGRTYYRAWHINRIRNARLLQRLTRRGHEE